MENPRWNIPAQLIQALQDKPRVTVLTGAGASAESGIPTFRDDEAALWGQYKPEDLATPQAFGRNPKLVWEWYAWRREQVQRVEPNPGHVALAEMERRLPRFTLITQNVDGLHQRAGSRHVVELHGNLGRVKCFREGTVITTWSDKDSVPPRCPRCGSYLRPDVVWFGEVLPAGALQASTEAARACEIYFSIGTSAVVEPAASLAFEASERGALVVEINPQITPLSRLATIRLAGPSGRILPELVRAVWKK